MKPTPKDWEEYYAQLLAYTKAKQSTKPRRHEYATIDEYRTALRQWDFEFHCDKPNPPGYQFANND